MADHSWKYIPVAQGNPSASLAFASDSFNSAFDGMKGSLATIQSNEKIRNTNILLDAVDSFKSPEELQRAKDSGYLDSLRQQLGPNIDVAAARTSFDNAMGKHQKRAMDNEAYSVMKADRDGQQFAEAFKVAHQNKDQAGANAALEAFGKSTGGRGRAALIESGIAIDDRYLAKDRATTAHNQGIEEFKDKLLTTQNQRETSVSQALSQAMSARAAQSNAASTARLTTSTIEDRNTQRQAEADTKAKLEQAAIANAKRASLKDSGNPYAVEGVYSQQQSADLLGLMTTFKTDMDGNQKSEVLSKFSKGTINLGTQQDPLEVPIPYAALKAAILGESKGSWLSFDDGPAIDIEKRLIDSLKQTYTIKDKNGKDTGVVDKDLGYKISNQYNDFNAMLNGGVANPNLDAKPVSIGSSGNTYKPEKKNKTGARGA